MRLKKSIIIITLLSLLLASCGKSMDTSNPYTPVKQDKSEQFSNENNTKIETGSGTISNQEETSYVDNQEVNGTVHQEEPVPAYYVNEKYFIKPVTEEQSAEKHEKIALLTFDDSPAGESTQAILDILDKYNAKAIWFINGYYADKHKDLLKEIHQRGHIIGNHTWWHKNFKREKLTPEETRTEIVSINDLVEEVIGERPTYFRAPNGTYTDEAKKVIKEEKMQYMNWSVGSLDWELKKPEDVEKQVLDNMHNGANILFHDKKITANALDEILKNLSEQGYKFVLPTEVRIAE